MPQGPAISSIRGSHCNTVFTFRASHSGLQEPLAGNALLPYNLALVAFWNLGANFHDLLALEHFMPMKPVPRWVALLNSAASVTRSLASLGHTALSASWADHEETGALAVCREPLQLDSQSRLYSERDFVFSLLEPLMDGSCPPGKFVLNSPSARITQTGGRGEQV